MIESITKIRELISQDKIDEALQKLEKLIQSTDFEDEVILIRQKHEINKKNNRIGIIDYQQYILENSRITNSLLQILTEFGKRNTDSIFIARKIISFAKEYKITSLNLSFLELGFIPKELAEIANQVIELNLSNNFIQVIPEWIKEFNSLKYLDLSKNKFTTVNRSLGELTSLVMLDLSSNEFKHLPDTICQLKNLEKLACHFVDLESLPRCLFQSANGGALKYLHLENEELLNISEDAVDSANALRIMLEYLQNNKKTVPNKA